MAARVKTGRTSARGSERIPMMDVLWGASVGKIGR